MKIPRNFIQPSLETPRLFLEPITVDHSEEVWELFSDNELHHFVPYEPLTVDRQRERCARWAKRVSPDGDELWLNWLGRDKQSGSAMAHIQAGVKEDGVASVGYLVARKFQRQGFGHESLHAIFEYLQFALLVREIKAWSDSRNIASHNLAKKLGMTQVEFLKDADFFKGATSDELVFSKVFQR